MNQFSIWMIKEMEKHNWNLNQLSKETGLHHATLSYYIAGTRLPTLQSFLYILKAFNKRMIIVDNSGEEDEQFIQI